MPVKSEEFEDNSVENRSKQKAFASTKKIEAVSLHTNSNIQNEISSQLPYLIP